MSDYVKMGNGMLFLDDEKIVASNNFLEISKHKDGISIQLSEANAPSQAAQGDEIPF